MYKLLVVSVVVLSSFLAKAQNADSIWVAESKQKLSINTVDKDFGVIAQYEKTTFKYKFTNLNKDPLVIWHVTTSCGCTSPQWTEKPVKEGQEAIVKVKYDSSKPGSFNKSVYVYTNFDDKPINLTISGNVIAEKTSENLTKKTVDFKAKLPTTN